MSDQPSTERRIEPIPLFSDRPEEAAKHFHFDALCRSLIGMLAGAGNPTPFVYLVDGKWGSGKTSLMRTVMASLAPAVEQQHLRACSLKADDPARAVVEESPLRHAPMEVVGSELGAPCPDPEDDSEAAIADCRINWLSPIVDKVKDEQHLKSFFERFRPVRRVFFNAWKYKDEAEIFPALAHELLAAMRADGWLAGFQALTQEVASSEWRDAVAKLAAAVPHAGGALAAVIERPSWLREVALYDRARPYIQALASAWASTYSLRADAVPERLRAMLTDDVRSVMRHIRGLRSATDRPSESLPGIVAIFIDDLDRCPKEHVNQVLKAVNLLVDMESCAFVLGADQERVAEAVQEAYRGGRDQGVGDDYGSRFLSKIVQLHLTLPEAGIDEMNGFLESLLAGDRDGKGSGLRQVLRDNQDLLEGGLPANPREVKRFLNVAVMRLALLQALGEVTAAKEQATIAYLLVVSELPRSLRSDPGFLLGLQEMAAEQKWRLPTADEPMRRHAGQSGASVDLDELVRRFPKLPHARELLSRVDIEAWPRILGVLGALVDKDNRLTLELIRELASLGGAEPERGPAAVEPSREELEQEAEKAEQKLRKIRESATELLSSLRDAVVEQPQGKRAGALLRQLRVHGERWEEKLADDLVEAISEEDPEDMLVLADAAHTVLKEALSRHDVAERRDALTWALLLRDATVEKAPIEDMDWSDERAAIEAQLAGVKGEPAGEPWRLVSQGPFIAGSYEKDHELPVRVEDLARPFWVSNDPVTVAEYGQFVTEGYGDLSQSWWAPFKDRVDDVRDRGKPYDWEDQQKAGGDRPVVGVAWFEAVAYCRWLNQQQTGSCEGPNRLPTETEWEMAARGLFGRRWPWGCSWRPELVVCDEEGSPSRNSLAGISINRNLSPFEVRGMAGNVWEWTSTRWKSSGFGEAVVDAAAMSEIQRDTVISLRGGSFRDDRGVVRCAFRVRNDAWNRHYVIGFRCVRDV
jgi:formylglycine-generating enzyme required for sulfatase activity